MATIPPHRKRVQHFDEPGEARELTFSCYQRMPLLTSDLYQKWLSESLDRAMNNHSFDLIAFVYMPEHVHLLVFPRLPTCKAENLLYAIKRPFSWRIKQDLIVRRDPLLQRLSIRERPGKMTFRFWQEGPGYDRNMVSHHRCIASADYIHANPVRRGLCRSPDEWKWSSWRYYSRPNDPPDPDLPRVHGPPR